ncbi:MAG: hypothetical protein K0S55_1693, partial [Clostridia bacterium]|nr:hypothetical protein [Clostridia bacterium]
MNKNLKNFKILTVAKYELKMLQKSIAGWLVLTFTTAVALIDNFPSAENLKRLELLPQSGFAISRVITQAGIILLFGFLFIISNRIKGDIKKGIMPLFAAAPIKKTDYLYGKFLGSYAYILLMWLIYIAVNGAAQTAFNPGGFDLLPAVAGFF